MSQIRLYLDEDAGQRSVLEALRNLKIDVRLFRNCYAKLVIDLRQQATGNRGKDIKSIISLLLEETRMIPSLLKKLSS